MKVPKRILWERPRCRNKAEYGRKIKRKGPKLFLGRRSVSGEKIKVAKSHPKLKAKTRSNFTLRIKAKKRTKGKKKKLLIVS